MKIKIETWELADADALVALLRGPSEWIENGQIVKALGLVNTTSSKSIISHWKETSERIGAEETKIVKNPRHSKQVYNVRVYTKKAVIMIALRSQTKAGLAFKEWLAATVVDVISSPRKIFEREANVLKSAIATAVHDALVSTDPEFDGEGGNA